MSLVGWLRRLLGSPAVRSGTDTPTLPEGWGALAAVGESQYQPALDRIAKQGRVCSATLVAEPNNPFDRNAVVVRSKTRRSRICPAQTPSAIRAGLRIRCAFRRNSSAVLATSHPSACCSIVENSKPSRSRKPSERNARRLWTRRTSLSRAAPRGCARPPKAGWTGGTSRRTRLRASWAFKVRAPGPPAPPALVPVSRARER